MMLKIFYYIIVFLVLILYSSCVRNITYYGDKNAKEINYPFISIIKDKDNIIRQKNITFIGGNGKTIVYYKNGNKNFQGRARYIYNKGGSHVAMRKKGKHKYWSKDGKLIWVEIFKKDTTINSVTREVLEIVNKKEE